jgi:hypothetical protein
MVPFAVPSPEGSGSAGHPKKVGSACASRFFFKTPRQRFHERSFLRMFAASAVTASDGSSRFRKDLLGREHPS